MFHQQPLFGKNSCSLVPLCIPEAIAKLCVWLGLALPRHTGDWVLQLPSHAASAAPGSQVPMQHRVIVEGHCNHLLCKKMLSCTQNPFSGCVCSSVFFKRNAKQKGFPLSSALFSCSYARWSHFLTHSLCICPTLLSFPEGSELWCPSCLRSTRGLPDRWLWVSQRDRQLPLLPPCCLRVPRRKMGC